MIRFPVFIFFLFTFQCHAQEEMSSQSNRSQLIAKYAGTGNFESLLAESDIDSKLHILLGNEYQHFHENILGKHGGIDVIDGGLLLQGSRKRVPARENAALCIDELSQVHAVIFSDENMTVFSPSGTYPALPTCVKQYVYGQLRDRKEFNSPPRQGGGEFQFRLVHGK